MLILTDKLELCTDKYTSTYVKIRQLTLRIYTDCVGFRPYQLGSLINSYMKVWLIRK